MNLSNVALPFNPGQAMATVPLTDRTQTLRVFDTGLRNQYYQNWNLSLQREITRIRFSACATWGPRAASCWAA